jgi:amino acid adenylation domain-containing protein
MTRMSHSIAGEVAKLSKAKAELLKLLLEKKSRQDGKIDPLHRPKEEVYRVPTSLAQQRLWFIDQLTRKSSSYQVPIAVRLSGMLDNIALQKALNALVERHEVLRAVFVSEGGEPQHEISPTGDAVLQYFDITELRAALQEAEIMRHKIEEAHGSFDLRRGPLLRGRLLRLRVDEHVMLVTMHHIITDGWSKAVFVKELSDLYRAFVEGRPSPLPPLTIQYGDYAHWHRQHIAKGGLETQLNYWRRTLDGASRRLELPTDHARPGEQSFRGDNVPLMLDIGLCSRLKALAQQHDMTLFMVLCAGWAILLGRLAGQDDVLIGTPVANRRRPELEGMIGLFANTVVIRAALPGSMRLAEFLARIREGTLGAYDNQDAPFEKVVEMLQPERSLERNPLFQVMFVLQNVPRNDFRLPGLVVTVEDVVDDSSIFDLFISLEERGEIVGGTINYATDLFERRTIVRWALSYLTLLDAMAGSAEQELGELPVLPAGQRSQVLTEFNLTSALRPHGKLVHQLFEEQAQRAPASVAVICEDQSLTYAELNTRANDFACFLRGRGVRPDQLVGVCLSRGLDMVICLLGILKAGGAYLPLDPTYPAERLKYMIEDAGPGLVVITQDLRASLPQTTAEIIELQATLEEIRTAAVTDHPLPGEQIRPDSLVYVIYTSGSTGRPKGTAMPHGSMVNLIEWHRSTLPAQGQRVLQFAALSFDVAFQEIFSTLCSGGTLVMLDDWLRRDARALMGFLIRMRISRLFLPPLMLQSVAECAHEGEVPRGLRDIITAGEQLRISPQVRDFMRQLDGCTLHNHYGPTETHVVTSFTLTGDPANWPDLPCIGRPIANAQIYVLDERKQPTPIGVTGEVFIGGANLARGYLRRPALTSERFISDPFGQDGRARLYRTGDTGRWRADGTLEYLGRNDDQVKIRGFRVELSEIEARLAQHPAVKEVAIAAQEGASGSKQLVAYVTYRDRGASAEDLRVYLAGLLPTFMVPSAFVKLDALPLTPSGKLNRRALPAPQRQSYVTRVYEEPRGESEQVLAWIWKRLLRVERVGRQDSFFELGGHSLLIVQMKEQLQRVGLSADVRDIYESPTLAALAAALVRHVAAEFAVPRNLIPGDCEAITPEMLTLVRLESHQIQAIARGVPGGMRNIKDIYPLSPLQEGMLFHHLTNPGMRDVYTRPLLISLASIDKVRDFTRALQATVDRHDILRTGFIWQGVPSPVQVVCRSIALPVEEVELDRDCDPIVQLNERMLDPRYNMDLRQAPLIRLEIAADPDGQTWYAILRTHHLIFDNQSLHALLTEVIAHMTGREHELAKPVPYRDHVAHAISRACGEEDEAFFRSKLGDFDEPSGPFGLLEPDGSGQHSHTRQQLGSDLATRVRAVGSSLGVSPAALMHASWGLVVAATSGREDVVFGTVLLGRGRAGAASDGSLGMFINTLPLRLRLAATSAADLVTQTQRELVDLLSHEQASLALARRCSGVSGATPLFSALLNYWHGSADVDLQFSDAGLAIVASKGGTNYPCMLSVVDQGDIFLLDAKTDPRIDSRRLVELMRAALCSLLGALECVPGTAALDLCILPAHERAALASFNETEAALAERTLIHQLFEEQVARTPQAPAIVCQGDSLTYAEVNARANQLARYLACRGVGPDQTVALCLERSVDILVGMLGVLKAGGAYVPLDPDYPAERLSYMLADAKPKILLIHERLISRFPALPNVEIVPLDAKWDAIGLAHAGNLDPRDVRLCLNNLAYIIYTSGSTGRPKGVMIEHGHLLNLRQGLASLYRETGFCQRVAVNASFTFDSSIKQLVQVTSGSTIVLVPQSLRWEAALMRQFIKDYQIECIDCTPSQLRTWVSEGVLADVSGRLRMLLVGGEPIDTGLWRSLAQYPAIDIYNVYGPTECTVDATFARVEAGTAPPHIGRPMENKCVYVLDRRGMPVPIGVTGELCIGGMGVGRGYLNRPDLTAERFVPNPFRPEPGARLYKTGDLARWRPSGEIEYLGRNDDQVKIRGLRLELGEVEAQLLRHARVAEAAVVVREDVPGEKRVVAYLSVRGAQDLDVTELREHMRSSLPEYMVPVAFVILANLPRTPSGKLDRRALPTPGQDAYARQRDFQVPEGSTERALGGIWRRLLSVERIGRDDNFFELGGHSLLGIKLVAAVFERLRVALPVTSIFRYPTIRQMAELVDREAGVDQGVLEEIECSNTCASDCALGVSGANLRSAQP